MVPALAHDPGAGRRCCRCCSSSAGGRPAAGSAPPTGPRSSTSPAWASGSSPSSCRCCSTSRCSSGIPSSRCRCSCSRCWRRAGRRRPQRALRACGRSASASPPPGRRLRAGPAAGWCPRCCRCRSPPAWRSRCARRAAGLRHGHAVPARLSAGGARALLPAAAFYWGLNGVLSVIGSIGTMVVAVNLGFQVAMVAGGRATWARRWPRRGWPRPATRRRSARHDPNVASVARAASSVDRPSRERARPGFLRRPDARPRAGRHGPAPERLAHRSRRPPPASWATCRCAMVESPDGRHLIVTQQRVREADPHRGGRRAVLLVKSRLTLDHAWLGLAWHPDGRRALLLGRRREHGGRGRCSTRRHADARAHLPSSRKPSPESFVGGLAVTPRRPRGSSRCTCSDSRCPRSTSRSGRAWSETVDLPAEPYTVPRLAPTAARCSSRSGAGPRCCSSTRPPWSRAARSRWASIPNAMVLSRDGSRLFVACANTNAVWVVDLAARRRREQIGIALYPGAPPGSTPERARPLAGRRDAPGGQRRQQHGRGGGRRAARAAAR